ncbi:hypothetical protein CGRA01v4_04714 [Colletotrichum graminicola]|nr:hypothetical protein CGRA01v4_04714 [Colletotrichum graminicola]
MQHLRVRVLKETEVDVGLTLLEGENQLGSVSVHYLGTYLGGCTVVYDGWGVKIPGRGGREFLVGVSD